MRKRSIYYCFYFLDFLLAYLDFFFRISNFEFLFSVNWNYFIFPPPPVHFQSKARNEVASIPLIILVSFPPLTLLFYIDRGIEILLELPPPFHLVLHTWIDIPPSPLPLPLSPKGKISLSTRIRLIHSPLRVLATIDLGLFLKKKKRKLILEGNAPAHETCTSPSRSDLIRGL